MTQTPSFGNIKGMRLLLLAGVLGSLSTYACTSRQGQPPRRTGEPVTSSKAAPDSTTTTKGADAKPPRTWTTGRDSTGKPATTAPVDVAVRTPVKAETKKSWETGAGSAKGRGPGMAAVRGKSDARMLAPSGSAGSSGLALGGAGAATGKGPVAAKPMMAPSTPAAAGPAMAEGEAADMAAGPSALSRRDAVSADGRRPGWRHHRPEPQGDRLTAGSFDDTLDLGFFSEYWQRSPLAGRQIVGLGRPDWRELARRNPLRAHKALQLLLVIDTTGSMGDELEYLKNEFKSIVAEVNRSYPAVRKEYAVIVYRDDTDDYVTRGLAFTRDLDAVQEFISEQSADGGGDYPEAVHVAFEEAKSRLDWDLSLSTAKLLFHIADAPPHDGDLGDTFRHVKSLRDAGVAIYPVAASGVADMAEAVMRAAAVMTGGQYAFLTDDSGIGNSHAVPNHPCYHVERMKDVMIRMVTDRLGGVRTQPDPARVIRTVGNPQQASCRVTISANTPDKGFWQSVP